MSALTEASASEQTAADLCSDETPSGQFLLHVNAELTRLGKITWDSMWTYMTDIRPETEAALTATQEVTMAGRAQIFKDVLAFSEQDIACEDHRRQLSRIISDITMPPPRDTAKQQQLASVNAKLVGHYGSATHCVEEDKCFNLGDLSKILATSRDETELRFAWLAWHNMFDDQKELYVDFVNLVNEGSRDMGFNSLTDVWLSGYDMSSDAFRADVDALWEELKPLYTALHCYVRAKLAAHYGTELVPLDKPMPAHMLGNMWAQEWSNVYDLVTPYPDAPRLDATAGIVAKNMDAIEMSKSAEAFIASLGMRELPESFWTNSMFVKPEGREVVCHASAWDMDTKGDVRIKMCIEQTHDSYFTIQHELGHIYYYLYYNHLPLAFQRGPNDGFHEAIGDALTLSMTPRYLHQIGLLESFEVSPETTINEQLLSALERVAFLPFGLLIDSWRWRVFDGSTPPEGYNAAWWKLREELQGVSAPEFRGENHFDPGAKYHVPGNTPYLRYFLARILQFQLHKALCEAAGYEGPLHECSIYNSKAAGDKLIALLSVGASQPWQDVLEALTGTREMSAQAMLDYYAPLMAFLNEQNAALTCGY
ncbi:MAG: M2 family metallopeptidase [Proteobacteria bacterium]|nr:M2 family metallopeptidase [Pseudomonadota bacterium]